MKRGIRMAKIDLSVIVASYNVQDYIEACLLSIVNTNFPKENLEIIVVDDGSTDNTTQIINHYNQEYSFIKVIHKENGGVSSTRNCGLQYAQGTYIAFVDGDDIVPPNAYSDLLYKAQQNNSDVVVGFVKRFDKNRFTNSYLHSFAIHDNYDNTTLNDNHDLLYDTTVWNKVYRREFLNEHQIRFIENMIYEDIPFTLKVHLCSKRTAIIENTVYEWRWRESSNSITQSRGFLDNFQNRLRALKISLGLLKEYGYTQSSSLIRDFMYKILFLDIYIYIQNLGDNEEEYIYTIQKMIYVFLRDWDLWNSDILLKLPVKHQIMYYAIKHFDWHLINEYTYKEKIGYFVEYFRGHKYRFQIDRQQNFDDLIPHLSLDKNNLDIDQKIRNISSKQLLLGNFSMRGAFKIHRMPLFKVWWQNKNVNEILTAKVVNISNNKELKIPIERRGTYLIHKMLKPNAKYRDASYRLSFNIKKVFKTLGVGIWKIKITSNMQNKYNVNSYASFPGKKLSSKAIMPYEDKDIRVMVKYNSVHNLVLEVSDISNQASDIPLVNYPILKDNHLQFNVDNVDSNYYNAILVDDNGKQIKLQNVINGFQMSIDVASYNELHNKTLKLVLRDNKTNAYVPYTFLSERVNQQIDLPHNQSISLYYGDTKNMYLYYEKTPLVAKEAKVSSSNIFIMQAELVNFNQTPSIDINQSRVEIISKNKKNRVVVDTFNNGLTIQNNLIQLKLPLTDAKQEQLNLLRSRYQLKAYLAINGHVDVYRIKFDNNLKKGKTPLSFNGKDKIYYQFKKDKAYNFILQIRQPYINWIDSNKLLRSFSYSVLYPLMRFLPLRNIMVFDSYWSTKFDSNEKAMYEYMLKNHPKIKTVWILNNLQTCVTGSAVKVRPQSLKYWYYLAISRYIVQNTNMPNRYAKRSGQIEVETLHGTFLKHMGFDEPHFRFAKQSVQNRFAKRNRRWDYLVVPSDYMETIATNAFDYSQKVIKSGFPRNDELYSNNNSDYIDSIKQRLGIPQNKKVILYAPTYRKNQGFDFRLDLDKLQERLSSEYVFLIRLHYFVAHSHSFYDNPGFVFDVSDYDNINDLYLISDALITDYSSVMFDYAHLKRPMLFYAYDKDWYLDDDNRGVYLNYMKDMPGPIITDEEDLIQNIQHLDTVVEQYGSQLMTFYNKFAQYGQDGKSTEKVVETVLHTNRSQLDQEPDNKLLFKKIGHLINTNYLQAKILNDLSNIVPKKRNLVMFDSFFGTQYSDNPKAIYEYMKEHYPSYKLYWNVNRDKVEFFKQYHIPYVTRFSYRGIWCQARAKYWVVNARRPFRWIPGKNVKVLQTWHGTPLKTLAADVMKVTMPGLSVSKYHRDVFVDNKRWNRLIAPNMYSAQIMQRAFRMRTNQMQLDGYPRNDILVNYKDDDLNRIKRSLGIDDNVKVILYAPTWRDNEYVKSNEFTAKLHLDLDKIKQHYDNVLILVRTHYLISNSLDLSDYSDIAMDVSAYPDISDLYLISDVLITDYSSVMFDYSVLKRPMIFFTYDLDAYANEIRGFYFDFVKEAPGPLVQSTNEVIHNLDIIFEQGWKPNHRYLEFVNKYSKWMDGKSSERAVRKMLSNHSLEAKITEDLTNTDLNNAMQIKDGAALWNKNKDFADSNDHNFAFNYNTNNKHVEVLKLMQLFDPEFKVSLGMQFALVQINNAQYWVHVKDLY
jgi:CDP-glycerol glycerophosphotransferase